MMLHAERIYQAYYSRKASTGAEGGWAKWETDNPGAAAILKEAERLAFSEGDGVDGG